MRQLSENSEWLRVGEGLKSRGSDREREGGPAVGVSSSSTGLESGEVVGKRGERERERERKRGSEMWCRCDVDVL